MKHTCPWLSSEAGPQGWEAELAWLAAMDGYIGIAILCCTTLMFAVSDPFFITLQLF